MHLYLCENVPHNIIQNNVRINAVALREVTRAFTPSSSVRLVIYLSCAILLVFLLWFFYYGFIRHRDDGVIKFSQPKMMYIMWFGAVTITASILSLTLSPSSFSCKLQSILLHTGFSCLLGGLFAKTWRVCMIYRATVQYKKTVIPNFTLYLMVGAIIFVTVQLLIVWMIIDPPVPRPSLSKVVTKIGDVSVRYSFEECSTSWIKNTLYAFETIALILTVTAAVICRKVGKVFAESKWFLLSLYNALFMVLLYAFLLNFVGLNTPDDLLVTQAGTLLWSVMVVSFLIFGHKMYMLYRRFEPKVEKDFLKKEFETPMCAKCGDPCANCTLASTSSHKSSPPTKTSVATPSSTLKSVR
jgi:hypothetical protein